MKISVNQGQCRINAYSEIINTEDVKILCFDTKDKYPVFGGISDNLVLVGIERASPSFRDRFALDFSEITIDMDEADKWSLICGETGRYSFYLILYKKNNKDTDGGTECVYFDL